MSRLYSRTTPIRYNFLRGRGHQTIRQLLAVFAAFVMIFVWAIALTPVKTKAATSSTLTFQARVLTTTGVPIPDGNYNVRFRLYDINTGGSPLWTEDYLNSVAGNDILVKNGFLYANLGSVTAFPTTINWDQELWLTMNLGNTNASCTPFTSCSPDGEMSPRFKITAVPYAFRAASALGVASNDTNAASTSSSGITIKSGNATGTTSNSGSITIDSGTATGATGTILLGTTNASGITIGRTGLTTTVAGAVTIAQNLTVDTNTLFVDSSANRVGIGNVSPNEALQVSGAINLGTTSNANAGSIRWTGTDFEGYNGSQWLSLTSTGTLSVNPTAAVRKSVDENQNSTINASATLQDDDQLKFAIGANETWSFRFVIHSNAVAAGDLKFAVTAPSGATCTVGALNLEDTVTVGTLGCGVSSGILNTVTAEDVYEVVGSVVNGATPGNITLQWAQNTANATTTIVRAGSTLEARRIAGSGQTAQAFVQNGNSFTALAQLGTNDNFGLAFLTNGIERGRFDASGNLAIGSGLTVPASALHVDKGLATSSALKFTAGATTGQLAADGFEIGIDTSGNGEIRQRENLAMTLYTNNQNRLSISGAGLVTIANGLSVNGGIDNNSDGITNAGVIAGATTITASGDINTTGGGLRTNSTTRIDNSGNLLSIGNITGAGSLMLASGGSGDLTLDSASNVLVMADATLRRLASGATTFDFQDSSNTTLALTNSNGSAALNLSVEGSVTASSFIGSGASLTNLNATNIASGTLDNARLNSNVAFLDATQSFTHTQSFNDGLILGNNSGTASGTLRWNGLDFEGYNGTSWVSLTAGSGGGTGAPAYTVTKSANEIVNNSSALQDDNELKFNVGASETWNFRFTVQGRSGVTPDFQFAVSAPSGSTCVVSAIDSGGSTSVSNLGCNVSTGVVPGTGNDEVYEVVGSVTTSATSGVVTLRWAQNTADPSNSTVYAGSALFATRAGGIAFLQGGNAFGGAAILGTTDNAALNFITNNATAFVISSTGNATFNNALAANGGLTIGNAASDGLTIVSDSVALTNGLNFDSNTFVIDAGNNRIGINNASPGNRVNVNTPGTAVANTEMVITASASGNKGLVIQGATSQSASLIEFQNNGGNLLASFGANGSLNLGRGSGLTGTIVLSNSTNNFTTTLQSGVATVSDKTITLPDETGTVCLSNSNNCGYVRFAAGSLQADSSNNDVIAINKTSATGNLMVLQRSGSGVFTIANTGALQIKATSTTGLDIQNGGGTAIFTVDTSGNIVRVGPTAADGTGIMFVLDSKNTAGDPAIGSETNAQYYNSSDGKLRCYEGGAWKDCIPMTTVVKGADQTVTNSATFQNDSALSFAMQANSTYSVEANINFSGTSAAGDFKYTFTVPAGATIYLGAEGSTTATTNTVCNVTASAQTCTILIAANFRGIIKLKGVVETAATAGNFQFQFAQNTQTAGQSVTIYEGSEISWKRNTP